MNVEKAKQWIEFYVFSVDGEYRQRVHTGQGLLVVPPDVYSTLSKHGVISDAGKGKLGYFFTGDAGLTFIEVLPFDEKKKRNRLTVKICDLDRQKKNMVNYARKIGIANVEKFDELPEKIQTELLNLPYSIIVRTLIVADLSAGEVSITRLAVRYGVEYRTIFNWIKGA